MFSRTEEQERLERLLEAQSRAPTSMLFSGSRDTGDVTSAVVNTLQAERDALAQELHRARQAATEDVQLVSKKQAVARQVNSFQEARGLVPVMPEYVSNDVMSWLQDRQAELPTG